MKALWSLIFLFIALISPAYGESLSPEGNTRDRFTAGPYILDVTTESAVVAFHLSKSLPARVKIIDKEMEVEFLSKGPDRSHFIKITGLRPGSTYRYEVICGAGEISTPESDPGFEIKTACLPGESFSFAVFGDPRPGETATSRHHQDIIEQITFHEPSFSLVLGDMVDNGGDTEHWEAFFKIESNLLQRTAIYPVMGDNDYADGNGIAPDFFPKLEKGYYSFDWGGLYFFGLNTWGTRGNQGKSELDADSPQIRWLETELSRDEVQKAPFRIVFLHDPVFISRGRSSDTLKQIWAPIFQKHNIDVVFASWHLYERSHNEGITYIISGGAGAELIWAKNNPSYPSLADAREYHFCRVDVNSNAMTIRAISADGTVLDNITMTPAQNSTDMNKSFLDSVWSMSKEIIINENLPEIPIYLFTTPDCGDCKELLNIILPELAEDYEISFKIRLFDLDQPGTYDLFLNAGAEFGRQDADLPTLFMGNSVLGGINEINELLSIEIETYLDNPDSYRDQSIVPFAVIHNTNKIKNNAFNALTFMTVLGAGLSDGIKPCALTAVICLICYIFFIKLINRNAFCFGGIFTLALFISAFLFELGLLNISGSVIKDLTFLRIVNSILLIVLIYLCRTPITGLISYLKGNVNEADLAKSNIIRQLTTTLNKDRSILTGVSIILGIVMAAMLMTCTGQEYLTISYMTSEPAHRFQALPYMTIYHIAFTLPLFAVFLFSSIGAVSRNMRGLLQRHMITANIGLAVFCLLMAITTICNLF